MSNLLSINDLEIDEVNDLLKEARSNRNVRYNAELLRKSICNLFFEDSTRTRISFELAAKRMGAIVINFSEAGSSTSKGESLIDTALTLNAMDVDVFVVRHGTAGAPATVARWTKASVVNAGDGMNEHPTQALLDLYTIKERLGGIAGLHVGIVGDVKHSRVAGSLRLALAKMGAKVTLTGPRELVSARPGFGVNYDFPSVLKTLDVAYMLRSQTERHMTEYNLTGYDLTSERFNMMPEHAIVMHAGPVNRGIEIDSVVVDHPRSAILDQVKNGVVVRMAVLRKVLS